MVGLIEAPVWREEHLRLAIEAACVALWAWHVDDDRFSMDELGFELWSLPWAERVAFEELSAHIHPADRDRVRAAFSATRSVAGSYEIDFRIMVEEEIRWISARGQGADAGIVDGVMFGIFLDVTGRKQAEEGSELLAGEMSHRVKKQGRPARRPPGGPALSLRGYGRLFRPNPSCGPANGRRRKDGDDAGHGRPRACDQFG
jgi:hypothetical protein